MKAHWLAALSLLGTVGVGLLVWDFNHAEPPPAPVAALDLFGIVGLLVGPWLVVVERRLARQPGSGEVSRAYRRVIVAIALLAVGGPLAATTLGALFIDKPDVVPGIAGGISLISIAAATLVALVGAVLLPWMYLLTRTVTRERAARARAEERADMAAHLHDTVLQTLTLIRKQTEDPAIMRLTRSTERELRAWLYGAPPTAGDDFAAALVGVTREVEDRFGVAVELGTVGTALLSAPVLAVLGAAREALTNAGKHAGVRRVTTYAEVTDGEVYAVIRDRGCGFDGQARGNGRRGISDSIVGRMQRHGGTAVVHSAPGEGTEVELRMPLGVGE